MGLRVRGFGRDVRLVDELAMRGILHFSIAGDGCLCHLALTALACPIQSLNLFDTFRIHDLSDCSQESMLRHHLAPSSLGKFSD